MNHPPPIPSKKKNQTNKNTPTSCNGKQSNNDIVLSFLFFFGIRRNLINNLSTQLSPLKKITISGLHARVIVGKVFRHSEHSSMLAIIAMTS